MTRVNMIKHEEAATKTAKQQCGLTAKRLLIDKRVTCHREARKKLRNLTRRKRVEVFKEKADAELKTARAKQDGAAFFRATGFLQRHTSSHSLV